MSNSTNESDVGWIVARSQLDPPQNNVGRLKGKISKRPWTPEEDAILNEYVKNYGSEKWDKVKKHYKLDRTGKSCRFRYVNHLHPKLKKGPFTPTEKQLIIQLHDKFGNQWALIAKELPGRRDNQIKNFWNTINKKQKRISLPCDPPAVPAQLYIGNPVQSMGDYNSAYDGIHWAVNVRGGNPESFFEGCKSHTGAPLYGRASLDSSRNIVSSQDSVSQVRGFSHSLLSSTRPQANQIFPSHSSVSSTRPQAHQIFLPGPLYDFSGRSTQPSIFSNEYGSNMITNNIVSTGGGPISANRCLINNNYSTSRTSLGAEEAELPSFECSKFQHHDQYHDAAPSSHIKTSYSNLHSPTEAVPVQSDSRFVEYTLEELLEEADDMVDNFKSDYFMPKFDELSDLDIFSERSNAPVFSEPTPDELPRTLWYGDSRAEGNIVVSQLVSQSANGLAPLNLSKAPLNLSKFA